MRIRIISRHQINTESGRITVSKVKVRRPPYYAFGALGHLGHSFGALGALVWGTWGTRLGHLGHSFGELGAPGALVWGTQGTRLGHLRHSSGALEAIHQEPMYLMQSSEALGALIFDAPKDNLTHLSEADV